MQRLPFPTWCTPILSECQQHDIQMTGPWRPSFWSTSVANRVRIAAREIDKPVVSGHLGDVTLIFSNSVHAHIIQRPTPLHPNDRAVTAVIFTYVSSQSSKDSGPWNRYTGHFGAFERCNAYLFQPGTGPYCPSATTLKSKWPRIDARHLDMTRKSPAHPVR